MIGIKRVICTDGESYRVGEKIGNPNDDSEVTEISINLRVLTEGIAPNLIMVIKVDRRPSVFIPLHAVLVGLTAC